MSDKNATLRRTIATLRSVSLQFKHTKALLQVVGPTLLAVSYFLRGVERYDVFSEIIFFCGLFATVITPMFTIIVDRDYFDLARDLHEAEQLLAESEEDVAYWNTRARTLASWVTLFGYMRELVDQALSLEEITTEQEQRFLTTALEFCAERTHKLFGMQEDYWNISVYEYFPEADALLCTACQRARPSDALLEHRSWKVGEGHVGKTFERKEELICSDATHPDIVKLIRAPVEKSKPTDDDRYVSLASFPLAIDHDAPLGVLIVTSDVAGRFQSKEAETDDDYEQELKQDAMREYAQLLAQLLFLIHVKGDERRFSDVKTRWKSS